MKRIAFALLVCALPAAASEALRIEHFPPGEEPPWRWLVPGHY